VHNSGAVQASENNNHYVVNFFCSQIEKLEKLKPYKNIG
jgi:hypothetical protein